MEWAVYIGGPADPRIAFGSLDAERLNAGAKLQSVVELTARLIAEYFGHVAFTRWVYGNEFCERLIPSLKQLESVVALARKSDVRLSLLTPYVSDAGLASLRPLLEMLDRDGEQSEVVFNDWGMLNMLRREFPRLMPVQGRLMNKSLRDPRVTGMYAESAAPSALVTLRRSNLHCASYAGFLTGQGVEMAELDNLPQGIDLGFVDAGMNVSVSIPFGFISTSRICMAAGLGYAKRDKFQPGARCRHECQSHQVEFSYTNSPFGNRDQKFYLKGNTYFYAHTEAMLRSLFEQARAGLVGRLVFQPCLPMSWEGE